MNIKIYDAIMGSGKTHDAIERMKKYLLEDIKFIYITPFKSEIARVQRELNSPDVYAPVEYGEKGEYAYELKENFIDENGQIDLNAESTLNALNKRAQFLKMTANGKNIISSHSLFMSLKKTDFNLFNDYILILDEVVTPLQSYNIGAKDIEILRNQELIIVKDDTNEVMFINDDYNDPAFRVVKSLCNNSTVYYLDKYFFVWVFPIEIFLGFKEVQVLTYLFKGSLLSAYFDIHQLNYCIVNQDDKELLNEIKNLLNIYEGRANSDFRINAFSKTWIDNLSKVKAKKIVDSVSNIFKRNFNTTSISNAFTTFKPFRAKLAGKGYTKGFIAINARASNDYKHKKSMAYLGNRFFDPQTKSFFNERNINLDEDLWALCELIQWIWRGCIRDKKEMNLFIPSRRMRNLLNDWLDGKYININEKLNQVKLNNVS